MNAPINFETLIAETTRLDVLPAAVVTSLMGDIVASRPAIHDGRTYSSAEVRELMRKLQNGEKVTKISQYRGDYLMTQGAVVTPKYENEDMNYTLTPAEEGTKIGADEIPVVSCLPDLYNVSIGGVRYYLDLGVKEDIKLFATLFSYVTDNTMTKKLWQTNVQSSSYWAREGVQLGPTPYRVLEHIVPPNAMSGQSLMEYLYQNKTTWPLVQSVVYAVLKDVVIPEIDEDGEQVFDEVGRAYDLPIITPVRFTHGQNTYVKGRRIKRTNPKVFKTTGEKYKSLLVIKKVMDDVKIQNYLECNNDYYDGIDYSKNLGDIRAKIAILDGLELDALPNEIGVVTGQLEEFHVVQRYFGKEYPKKKLVRLSQNAAQNFVGFKLFMKPISTMHTVPIHDRSNVNRAMIWDTGLAEAIHAGEYPKGLGFMTNILLAHHKKGQEATPKTVPGEINEAGIPIDNCLFKQLHSEFPLSCFPYIYWESDLVEQIPSRETVEDPIANLRMHMWHLLNFPYTALSMCQVLEQSSPAVHWSPGKTAMDVLFELDAELAKGVPYSKSNEIHRARVVRSVGNEQTSFLYHKSSLPVGEMLKEKETEERERVKVDNEIKIPQKMAFIPPQPKETVTPSPVSTVPQPSVPKPAVKGSTKPQAVRSRRPIVEEVAEEPYDIGEDEDQG